MPETLIKNPKREGQKELVEKLRTWRKRASDERIRYETMWYEIQLMKDGDQWRYTPTASSQGGNIKVFPLTRKRGEIQRTVNKFRALMRGIKSFTTTTKLRWDVPGGSEDAAVASIWLNWITDNDPKIPETIKEVLEYGFLRSVGYFDPVWNPQKLRPELYARDPYDLLMDKHGKYACRTFFLRREDAKEQVKADGTALFDLSDEIQTSKRRSSSDIWQSYLESKYSLVSSGNKDLDEILFEEYHILKGDKVEVITVPWNAEIPVGYDSYEDNKLRFVPYWPEKRANDMYNEPWMKDAMDPQRALNNYITHFEEFIRTMGKGRWLKEKGTILDRVTDRDGQVVEWSGSKPEQQQPGILGGDQQNLYHMTSAEMEDVVGIHPSQVRKTETARGISYLMAQDETNVAEPTDNLKSSLAQVGRRFLQMGERYMLATEDLWFNQDQDQLEMSVISGKAGNIPSEAKKLRSFDRVSIDLIPTGPFASIAREEKIKELATQGIIRDPQTILEGMNIGNVRQLVEREKKMTEQFGPPGMTKQAPEEQPAPSFDPREAIASLRESLPALA